MPFVVQPLSQREHISFSQLVTFARCGEAYRRKYIEGEVEEGSSVAAVFGSAFHDATAFAEEWGMLTPNSDQVQFVLEERVKDVMRSIIRNQFDDDPDQLRVYGNHTLEWYYRTGVPNSVGKYLKMRQLEAERGVTPAWDQIEFEYSPFEVPLELTVQDQKVVGAIDQVMVDERERLFLRDLKTGKPKPQDRYQLEVYRYLLAKQYGIEADYGQLAYLRANGKTYEVQVVRFELPDSAIERMIQGLVQAQAHEVFPLSGPYTGECDYCSYAATCPFGSLRPPAAN